MKSKTNKSIAKRFRFTRTGKVLSRGVGQNHFRAKKRPEYKRDHRKMGSYTAPDMKEIRQILFG